MRHGRPAVLRSVGLAAWIVAIASPAAHAEPPAPAPGTLREYALVRRVRLPILLTEEQPGACAGLSPEWIEVLEDGRGVRAAHLDPQRLTTVHAILLDTSRSMIDVFQQAKRAASRYLDTLPANEPSLFATFDDSFILHAPLATDRSRLKDRLVWAEFGQTTTFWDSARQMIRYLASLPERKVLILLTDGCDTQRTEAGIPGEVLDLAARTDSLAVFPIGFKLPATCPGTSDDPTKLLKLLARRTGGAFFHLRDASELAAVLPEIRRRLDVEAFVAYAPLPFGEGPKDRAGECRWREVEIRLRRKMPGCAIELAGAPLRYECADRAWFSGSAHRGAAPLIEPLAFDEARAQFRGAARDTVRDRGPLAVLKPSAAAVARMPGDTTGSTAGAPDVFVDLSNIGFVSAGRGARFEDSPRSETATRPVALLVPPLRTVVRPDASRVRPFLLALAGASRFRSDYDLPALDGGWKRWTDAPFLVNGRTLLELRRPLAAALATRPDYHAWAKDKVRRERLAALDELVRTAAFDVDADDLAAIRALLGGEGWEPEPDELERHLAAWLGDIPAVELYGAAESWIAWELVEAARRSTPSDLAAVATETERLWGEVAACLPLPTDVRLLGLLVPGYDPALDLVGFYRIVLPRPDSVLRTWHFSEDVPVGVRLVRWMLERDELAPLLRERFEVQSIFYAHDSRRDLGPVLKQAGMRSAEAAGPGLSGRLVTVVFSIRDDPTSQVLASAYLPVGADAHVTVAHEPVCIVLPAAVPASGVGRRFYEALASSAAGAGVRCVLREKAPGP